MLGICERWIIKTAGLARGFDKNKTSSVYRIDTMKSLQ